MKKPTTGAKALRFPATGRLAEAIGVVVLREIRVALERHDGDRTAAAAFLGVSRRYIAEVIAEHADIAARWPGVSGRRKKST